MRGATGVTIQPHQILRLSRRKTHVLNPHHMWNLIYNARSNRCHDPTSPNIAPVTRKDSHAESSSHMKTSFTVRGATGLPLQHHQILRLPHKIPFPNFLENLWEQMKSHFQFENDPRMIRPWSEHNPTMKPTVCNPPRKRGYFLSLPRAFSIVKYNVSRPILHSNLHQVLHLPRKVTLRNSHQVLHLPRKVTLELHQILHLPRKVTLDLHQILHLPRKVTLELHQVLHLPRKVTLELHEKWHLTFKYCTCHEKWHLTFTKYAPAMKSDTRTSPSTAQWHIAPVKVTLELHQVLHLPRKVTLYWTLLKSTPTVL